MWEKATNVPSRTLGRSHRWRISNTLRRCGTRTNIPPSIMCIQKTKGGRLSNCGSLLTRSARTNTFWTINTSRCPISNPRSKSHVPMKEILKTSGSDSTPFPLIKFWSLIAIRPNRECPSTFLIMLLLDTLLPSISTLRTPTASKWWKTLPSYRMYFPNQSSLRSPIPCWLLL